MLIQAEEAITVMVSRACVSSARQALASAAEHRRAVNAELRHRESQLEEAARTLKRDVSLIDEKERAKRDPLSRSKKNEMDSEKTSGRGGERVVQGQAREKEALISRANREEHYHRQQQQQQQQQTIEDVTIDFDEETNSALDAFYDDDDDEDE